MVILAITAGNAIGATNTTTLGNITWDFNNTASFGGGGTAKWTNNADVAKFDKGGTFYVNVNNAFGQVGCSQMIFGSVGGNWVFTNQLLQIDAGGIVQTLTGGSTGLIFSNNVQMMASQTWSINAARPIKMMGSLSGSGPLTLDSQGYLGNYSFAGADTFTGSTVLTNGAMLTLDYSATGQNNAKLDPGSNLYLSPGLVVLAGATGSFAESVASTYLTGGGSSIRKSGAGTETLSLGALFRDAFSTYYQGADSLALTTTPNDASGILGCWAAVNAGWAGTNGLGAIVAVNGTASTDAGTWTNGLINVNLSNAAGVTNIATSPYVNALRFGGTTFLDLSNNVLTLAGGGLMAANSYPTLTNGFVQSGLASGELFIATVNNANLTNYATIQDNPTNAASTALVKFGDNTLILAGNNTYSGGTHVNGGSIQIPAGGNLGPGRLFVGNYLSGSPASIAASVLFNNPGTVSITNSLAGDGLIGNINSGVLNLTITNSGSTITVTNGNGTATLNLFAQGNNALGFIKNGTGTLVLGGQAGGYAFVNGFPQSGSAITCASGGGILVGNGNWIQSSVAFAPGAGSSVTVNGGSLTVYSGAAFNSASLTLNGGTFQTLSSNDRTSFTTDGQILAVNNGSMIISNSLGLRIGNSNTGNSSGNNSSFTGTQTGGELAVYGGGGSVGIDMGGSANSGKTVAYTISGGSVSVMNGGWLNIGADTAGGSTSSFTQQGTGKLLVSGTIRGGQAGATALQIFAFNGGTLAARTIDVSSLRSSVAGATGTLINGAGTLAPGDMGVAGLTTILGNYTSSNSAALAIDIGGTNYPAAFSHASGYYDSVAVTTNVTLGGSLKVNLINGFVPASTDSFLILASTNSAITNVSGTVTGGFNNLLSGNRVAVNGDTNTTFDVVVSSPWVMLNNYQSSVAANIAPTNVVASIQNILGTNSIVISGSGGSGSSGYTILTTTNLTVPLVDWVTNVTGVPFVGGAVNFTNAISPNTPRLFYRIRVP